MASEKAAEFTSELCLRALAAYGGVAGLKLCPLDGGLINETYLVSYPAAAAKPPAVLQRLSPIFGRAIHEDIEAVTAKLQSRGMITPRLYRTLAGELSVDLGHEGVWRLLTFIPGHSYSVMTAALAHSAGLLVGSFHAALVDLQHRFYFVRAGAHDLQQHVARLRAAVERARCKDRDDGSFREAREAREAEMIPAEFFPLAEDLLLHAETEGRWLFSVGQGLPLRICHGDLKLNNLRFDDAGKGICLLDLDTLAYLPLAFEMGDAFRSWCNPRGENVPEGEFDLDRFALAFSGYAAKAREFLTPDEHSSLVPGIARITFQLAVRFAVDVVTQNYFRYDATRFPNRAAHNLVRAEGQWSLYRSLAARRQHAESLALDLIRS
jgi:Ser/Thr protein kinase RdoA (MazF antagonist)